MSPSRSVTRADIRSKQELVTIAEAAAYLCVSTKTIRRLIAAGTLDAIRVGGNRAIRIEATDVAALKVPIRAS